MGFEELIQQLTLSNVCRGELEKDFQKLYPEIVSKLKKDQTGAITIKLSFNRKDEGQMVWLGYELSHTMPKQKKIHYAQISESGKLKTEAPPPEKSPNLKLFPGNQTANE